MPPITQRFCGSSVAPPRCSGVSPEKCGMAWKFLPQMSWATPRRKIDAPMVMMMSVTTEAPRAGSTANFSSARPIATVASAASTRANRKGTPAVIRLMAIMAPIITNSPCAKFTTSEAL